VPLFISVQRAMACVAVIERKEERIDPVTVLLKSRGGFNFANAKRNAMLAKSGMAAPKVMKTGTTICGIIYKDGVVLGADTRATEGPIVADKNCAKIHKISNFIYCCGAGTSADTENVTDLVRSGLELHRLELGTEPRVVTAMTRLKQHLFQYQGHVSAALVLGGVDATGPHLYTVYPHGSTDKLPYATMGSGSLAAMAVFEAGYKDHLDEKEAIALVNQAIQAGIFNDLGSGSNVDICVIANAKPHNVLKYMRGYEDKINIKPEIRNKVIFPKGTTEILKKASELREVISVKSGMDTSAE